MIRFYAQSDLSLILSIAYLILCHPRCRPLLDSPDLLAFARSMEQPAAASARSAGFVRPPTDENRRPREPDIRMEEKWDQGGIDRMQSFSAPAVEPGKAPAQ